MTDKRWKRRERRVAEVLAGNRSSVQGTASPDVTTPLYAVEVKDRVALPAWITRGLATARGHASDKQVGILVLHAKGSRDDLVVISMRDFRDHFVSAREKIKT
jgi:hypothetical protein